MSNIQFKQKLEVDAGLNDPTQTASRAVVTDGSQNLVSSATTSTEIGYVSGVTSSIQTQLNGKQASGSYITALTGDVTASGPGSVTATLAATSNATLTSLSALTSASSLATVGTVTSGTWNATTIAIAHGGTGQTSQASALTALTGSQTAGYYVRSDGTNSALAAIQAADVPTLNQNTTGTAANVTGIVTVAHGGTGDTSLTAYAVLCGGTTSTAAVQSVASVGIAGQVLTSNGAGVLPTFQAASSGSFTAPSVTVYTSGSGTYTTPTSPAPLYLLVEMVGGGAGGASSGATSNAGNAGGDTTFGSSFLTAGGATAPQAASSGTEGTAGGTATIGAGATGIAIPGAYGGAGSENSNGCGGLGGASAFGGAGTTRSPSYAPASMDASTNSGAGGGGGNADASHQGAAGGGAGGYIKAYITSSIASTYSYAVGAGGAGATGSHAGGAGASGIIIVTAYYQ